MTATSSDQPDVVTDQRCTSAPPSLGTMSDETPSVYEWIGGTEAIGRWLNAFYDAVEGDELLAPVFGGVVTVEHREHVTAWWAEVMGGPAVYSEELGGYEHMLAKHRGLEITRGAAAAVRDAAEPGRRHGGAAGRSGGALRADGVRRVGQPSRRGEQRGRRDTGRARSGPPVGMGRGSAVPAVRVSP